MKLIRKLLLINDRHVCFSLFFFPPTWFRYFATIDSDSYAASKVETFVIRISTKNSLCIYNTQIKSSHFRILIEICPILAHISFSYICADSAFIERECERKKRRIYMYTYFGLVVFRSIDETEAEYLWGAHNSLCHELYFVVFLAIFGVFDTWALDSFFSKQFNWRIDMERVQSIFFGHL